MASQAENQKIRAGFAAFKKKLAQDKKLTKSEIAKQLKLVANANNVSVTSSALDNFINTYKNAKFGPLQRAIAKFINSLKSRGSAAKPKSQASTATRTSPSDRFKGLAATQKKAQTKERPKATGKPGPRKKTMTAAQAAAQEAAARQATKKKNTLNIRKGPVQASSNRPAVKKKATPTMTGAGVLRPPVKKKAAPPKMTGEGTLRPPVKKKAAPPKMTGEGKLRPAVKKPVAKKLGPTIEAAEKITAKKRKAASDAKIYRPGTATDAPLRAFGGTYDPKTEVLRNVTRNGKRKTMVFKKKN
jgi:hypothetical protein